MGHEDLKRNVFVSYSRHDFVDDSQNVIPGNCVSKILETFERYGISYWIDKKGIYHGDKFKGVLVSAEAEDGIENMTAAVCPIVATTNQTCATAVWG